jgi:hypothetical protein
MIARLTSRIRFLATSGHSAPLRRIVFWSALTAVVFAAIHSLGNHAFVELDLRASKATGVSVYWANESQNYSEARSTHIRVQPNQRHYKLIVGDLGKIERLRFDPATSVTKVEIREFSIYQFGYEPIRLRTSDQLHALEPLSGIESYDVHRGRIEIVTNNGDPQLQYRIEDRPTRWAMPMAGIAWRTLLVVGLCVLLLRWLGPLSKNYAFVPYAMLAAFTVTFIMANNSRINAHPDEYVHIYAARYYADHTIPPGACDEATLGTFSPYGYSRLNSTEIAYFLIGKFANALAFLPVIEAFRLRYFNVFLFAILLLMSAKSASFRPICIPILASPQVWYIFSYVNSDAIALFTSVLAVHQFVSPDSLLRRLIVDSSFRHTVLPTIGLGVLAAVLLLIKKNFYVFDLFVLLWLGFQFVLNPDARIGMYARRLVPAAILAIAGFASWIYLHESANDFALADRIAECREQVAAPQYRETTPVEKTHPTLFWRDKGIPLSALFENRWGTRVFYSAFGHFGYLEVTGPDFYYQAFALIIIAFAVYLWIAVLRKGDASQRGTLLLATGMFFLLVALTIWKAWTRDFQPQGRYFFPMMAITGFTLAWCRNALSPRIITIFTLVMFAMSLYFFVFVGLPGIRTY